MLKHEQINQWVQLRRNPFDIEMVAKALGCSESYARLAIRRHFTGRLKSVSCVVLTYPTKGVTLELVAQSVERYFKG